MVFLKTKVLVSNATDATLQVPIGLSIYKNNIFSVTNTTNLLKHYTKTGYSQNPTNITFPSTTPGLTGLVYNESKGFVITDITGASAGSQFIIASEAGIVYGYNQFVNAASAIVGYTALDGAKYRGIAYSNNLIYLTDFFNAKIDVLNFNWELQLSTSYPFVDPNLPVGYSPFGIAVINNEIFVTYAFLTASGPMAGLGLGIVSVFSLTGVFKRRLASNGRLNVPYGLTGVTKHNKNEILVGNNSDGKINVYSSLSGKFLGTLSDYRNDPLIIPNLWSLANNNCDKAIYFTAGVSTTGSIGKIVKDNSDHCNDPCKYKKHHCHRECKDSCEDLCKRSPCRSRSNSSDSRSSCDDSISSRHKHHHGKHEKGCGCAK